MSGTKVNNYAIGDSDIEAVMLTTDQIYKGKSQVSLTEMSTTTVPKIAAGSWIENNGTLFKFDSDETLTGSPSDGIVYIRIVPSTDSCTVEMTNTAPTWSDSKQGWYGTGGYANYRYVGGCWIKKSSSYFGKFMYQNKQLYRPSFTYSETIATEFSTAISNTIVTDEFDSLYITAGESIRWTFSANVKLNTTGDGSNYGSTQMYLVNSDFDYDGILIDSNNNDDLNYKIQSSSDNIISATYGTLKYRYDTSITNFRGYNSIYETDDFTVRIIIFIAGTRTVYIKDRVLTVYFNNLVI